MTWTLHLPFDAIRWRSLNSRDHWSKRAADVEATHVHVRAALRRVTADPPPTPVHLTVTMWAADRRLRDVDNALASAKPAIDALVECGVIPDDNFKHVPVETVRVIPRPDAPGWTIELEAIG